MDAADGGLKVRGPTPSAQSVQVVPVPSDAL